jgi:hypothetical protein
MGDIEDYVGLPKFYSRNLIQGDVVEEPGKTLCQFVP